MPEETVWYETPEEADAEAQGPGPAAQPAAPAPAPEMSIEEYDAYLQQQHTGGASPAEAASLAREEETAFQERAAHFKGTPFDSDIEELAGRVKGGTATDEDMAQLTTSRQQQADYVAEESHKRYMDALYGRLADSKVFFRTPPDWDEVDGITPEQRAELDRAESQNLLEGMFAIQKFLQMPARTTFAKNPDGSWVRDEGGKRIRIPGRELFYQRHHQGRGEVEASGDMMLRGVESFSKMLRGEELSKWERKDIRYALQDWKFLIEHEAGWAEEERMQTARDAAVMRSGGEFWTGLHAAVGVFGGGVKGLTAGYVDPDAIGMWLGEAVTGESAEHVLTAAESLAMQPEWAQFTGAMVHNGLHLAGALVPISKVTQGVGLALRMAPKGVQGSRMVQTLSGPLSLAIFNALSLPEDPTGNKAYWDLVAETFTSEGMRRRAESFAEGYAFGLLAPGAGKLVKTLMKHTPPAMRESVAEMIAFQITGVAIATGKHKILTGDTTIKGIEEEELISNGLLGAWMGYAKGIQGYTYRLKRDNVLTSRQKATGRFSRQQQTRDLSRMSKGEFRKFMRENFEEVPDFGRPKFGGSPKAYLQQEAREGGALKLKANRKGELEVAPFDSIKEYDAWATRQAEKGRVATAVRTSGGTAALLPAIEAAAAGDPRKIGTPRAATTEDVNRAFPAASKVTEQKYGWEVEHKGLPKLRVVNVNSLEATPEGLAEHNLTPQQYAKKVKSGEVLGISGAFGWIGERDIIRLAKGESDAGTLFHESFHSAMKYALTEPQQRALIVKFGTEEKAADAYAAWQVENEAPVGAFTKIRDFFGRIAENHGLIATSPERVFRDIKSGRAFKVAGAESAVEAHPPRGQDRGPTAKVDSLAPTDPLTQQLSIRTTDQTKERFREAAEKLDIPEEQVTRYFRSLDNVARFVVENSDLLDYAPANFKWKDAKGKDRELSAVKDNSDPQYKESVDFSTMCRRRYKLVATIDQLQVELGRPLSASEFTQVRAELDSNAELVSCGACYVESRRMQTNGVIKAMADPRLDAVPREMFLTSEGITRRIPEQFPEEYRLLRSYMSEVKMKLPEARTEYRGELSKWRRSKVEARNRASGLRWQSWSDFELPHLLDAMEVIGDMHGVRLKGHAYTKELNFVRALAPTGMAINMSLIPKGTGLDARGNLVWDHGQSFQVAEARKLRKRYPNVGTVAIGISDAHIRKLLATPWIDYVIPYHASGLSKANRALLRMETWQDYENPAPDGSSQKVGEQNWIDLRTGKALHGIKRKLFVGEYEGDMDRFWEMAAANEVQPPFYRMRDWKGYGKLLTDRRYLDGDGKFIPQEVVRPVFNDRVLQRMLEDYRDIEGEVEQRNREPHQGTLDALKAKGFGKQQLSVRRPEDGDRPTPEEMQLPRGAGARARRAWEHAAANPLPRPGWSGRTLGRDKVLDAIEDAAGAQILAGRAGRTKEAKQRGAALKGRAVIRVTHAGDLDAAIEAMGWTHFGDFVRLAKDNGTWQQVGPQLVQLGKGMYPGNPPRGGFARAGFGELVTRIARQEGLGSLAPTAAAYENLLASNKGLGKRVNAAFQAYRDYQSQGALNRGLLDQAETGRDPRLRRLKRWLRHGIARDWMDDKIEITRATAEAEAMLGRQLKGWDNPDLIAKAMSGTSSGRAVDAYQHGVPDPDKPTDYTARTSPGIADDVLPLVRHLGRRKGPRILGLYLWANRALERWEAKGASVGVLPQDRVDELERLTIGVKDVDRGEEIIQAKLKEWYGPKDDFVVRYREGEDGAPYEVHVFHKGKDPGMSPSDAAYLVAELGKDRNIPRAAQRVYEYADALLRYRLASGAMTAEEYRGAVEESGNYVPLSRVMRDANVPDIVSEMRGGGGDPLKSQRGSWRRVRNPLQTLAEYTAATFEEIHKRQLANSLYRISKEVPDWSDWMHEVDAPEAEARFNIGRIRDQLRRIGVQVEGQSDHEVLTTWVTNKQGAPAESIFPIVTEKGERKYVYIEPNLYRALTGHGTYNEHGNIFKTAAFLNRTFKTATTALRPKFAFWTNPTRDFRAGVTQGQRLEGESRLTAPFKRAGSQLATTLSAIRELIPGVEAGEWHKIARFLGLDISVVLGIDRNTTRRFVRAQYAAPKIEKGKLVSSTGRVIADRVVRNPMDAIDFLREKLQASEIAPRASEMRRYFKSLGLTDPKNATWDQALEAMRRFREVTVDFEKMGFKMRELNQIVPFLNVRVQGPRANLRAWQRDPKGVLFAHMIASTIPALLNWNRNKDEDWWKRKTWGEKFIGHYFKVGDEIVVMPFSQEVDTLAFIPFLMGLEYAYTKDPRAFKEGIGQIFENWEPTGLAGAAWEASGGAGIEEPNMGRAVGKLPLPMPVGPLADAYANTRSFGGGSIDSFGEVAQNIAPEERYDERTTQVSKFIGKIFGVSPKKVDYLIENVLGRVTKDVIEATPGLRSQVAGEPSENTWGIFQRGGTGGGRDQKQNDLYDRARELTRELGSRDHPVTKLRRQEALNELYILAVAKELLHEQDEALKPGGFAKNRGARNAVLARKREIVRDAWEALEAAGAWRKDYREKRQQLRKRQGVLEDSALGD